MGTAAMLRAAGVGAGDEVVVPAFDDGGAARAVVAVGAVPVFADIDPTTYCLDADRVDAVVGSRTAAVVLVHRFGRPAATGPLTELGRRRGLLLLQQQEDGDEGADEDHEVARRRLHAQYFDGRLRGVRVPEGGAGHTYRQYVVRVPGNGRPDRDAYARVLRARGVDCRIPVPTPVHRLPEYRRSVVLPDTERAADETLALPVGAGLTRREARRIVSVCNSLGDVVRPAPAAWLAAAF
ncbi:DegT/DnrJ/EryC1/StrS family aminotransferase [Streptomyces sp. NPDC059816]|uniref:DegT/DnrJ/EryC1/StrS family aminotransferase n=1 Tax=Streptomyces sp. NPDC059816 TaxID=3346960 RepID=UPI00365338D3